MTKYHISPKTGRPNKCYATKRSCPIGGEDNHYASKEEAREVFEGQMADQIFASVKKKPKTMEETPELATYRRESDKVLDDMMYVAKEKRSLLRSAEDEGFERTFEKMKKIDAKTTLLKEKQGSLDENFRNFKKQWDKNQSKNQNNKKGSINFHKHPDRIREAINGPGGEKKASNFYSANAGTLNPVDRSGTGSQYITPGEQSLVIIGRSSGGGVRAISSYSDFYEEPEEELGSPIFHVKQGANRDTVDHSYYVLGYVGKEGDTHGWIPNRSVPFYVFK